MRIFTFMRPLYRKNYLGVLWKYRNLDVFDPWCSETIFRDAKAEDHLERKQSPASIIEKDKKDT